MKKKLISALLCVAMVSSMLVGCGSTAAEVPAAKEETTAPAEETTEPEAEAPAEETAAAEGGSVYYLNFKPEVDEQWQEIAAAYTSETGVDVKVVTAASGTYEEVLKSEIAGQDAPTLFQINGPVGYNSWKDYCLDLSGSELYNALSDKGLAITGEDGGAYGVPYTVESYGIIYNDAIMQAYFALDGAKAASVDEINSFDKLKEVVEDMTAKKADLGIEGVFASTSLLPGEDWRWQTHLANVPVYYEYKDNKVSDMAAIEFTYSDNYKNIFDLYINNSTVAPGLLGSKAVTDSMAEFALGQCAMVQNGNWAWGQISTVEGNTVKEENVKFMPIYTGVSGEENQGLCTGTENFWCVNSQANEADQKATLDFVNWMISSDTGKDYMVNSLGNSAPFTTFGDDEKPTDPLAKEMYRYMENGKNSVTWNFTTFPSQAFKDDFGAALLEYCNKNMTWDEVKDLVVTRWAEEKAATAQ
ncbi:carbohydrate ABC transporter substrate-binding protein (CUT1 family) [Kineothrix alysoides]|uniref:Carbohydrate ABC transporter substrate-binding protein (CUT1 family) n=1 Tax=Kineothrix alysoides TaxID=1469948 RepID=A0A4R1QNU1_9FIRM|nr:ABC transporter substrate-binding protein [Kineothrix alysoides]TCL55426.1 carbohydrate ABC transporter substrate-binding protein (CUT1 family) [Kineothrix alysoides]